MSRQFHYVVVFDEATKEWSVDYDVSINYDSGHVWDEESEEWSAEYEDVEDTIVKELNGMFALQASLVGELHGE